MPQVYTAAIKLSKIRSLKTHSSKYCFDSLCHQNSLYQQGRFEIPNQPKIYLYIHTAIKFVRFPLQLIIPCYNKQLFLEASRNSLRLIPFEISPQTDPQNRRQQNLQKMQSHYHGNGPLMANQQSQQHSNDSQTNFSYYHEYCRLYLANVVLLSQMRELANERNELTTRFLKLQKKGEQIQYGETNDEDRKKRFRRTANEIERHYRCPVETCQRSYGSEGSLNQHLKIKHVELYEEMNLERDGEMVCYDNNDEYIEGQSYSNNYKSSANDKKNGRSDHLMRDLAGDDLLKLEPQHKPTEGGPTKNVEKSPELGIGLCSNEHSEGDYLMLGSADHKIFNSSIGEVNDIFDEQQPHSDASIQLNEGHSEEQSSEDRGSQPKRSSSGRRVLPNSKFSPGTEVQAKSTKSRKGSR